MRQEILDYIQALNLGTFLVSSELPWVDNEVPLYLKNLKKVYVDAEQQSNEPFIATLDGLNLSNEVTTVSVYFANDAKQLPANYNDVITELKTAKNITTVTGVQRRECAVSTAVEADMLVTTLEFRFTKFLT